MEELEELFYKVVDQLSGHDLPADVQADAVCSASIHADHEKPIPRTTEFLKQTPQSIQEKFEQGQTGTNSEESHSVGVDNEAIVRKILSALRQDKG